MLEIIFMDNDINTKISDVILHAEANPFSFEVMKNASENNLPIIEKGCDDFEILLPMGYRIIYTVEEHPMGLCRHISVSHNMEQPSFDDLLQILNHFGFKTTIHDEKAYIYGENCMVNGKECIAINVIEKLF